MPLPHFLAVLAAVIFFAALTLWAAFSAGGHVIALSMITLTAAVILHLAQDRGQDHDV